MTLMKTLSAGVAAIALTTAFATVVTSPAMAQSTTGAIRGTVVGPDGQPVSGARVTITDTTTGASTTVVTGSGGTYSSRGLSVSGRYSVSVDTDTYTDQTISDIGLSLGDTTNVVVRLSGSSSSDEIVVVATRSSAAEVASGPSAVFGVADLSDLPVVNRDIKDVIRLDPRITIDESFERGIRCVGSNERFNSLTVDGVRQNDDFGLNNNGYPTQRLPFPFDVSEQVAVEIAPIDVEYGGFTGCNVNVVTKSGGNELHGRLFVDYNFASMHGDSLEDGARAVRKPDSDEKSYGAVITGPIIKDRLFFTAAYEKFKGSETFNTGPADAGYSNPINSITQADVDRVISIMNNVYGFDPLGIPSNAATQDERFYVKLNGFITDNHRFELAYQDTFGDTVVPQNTSSSNGQLGLLSNAYSRAEDLEAYSARIFSDWTDNFSTEMRVSYQDRVTDQISLNGTDFAQFEIATPGGGAIFVGPDSFRHGNALSSNVWNIKFKAEYDAGNHLIKTGYERDIYEAFNLFVPFSEGQVEFLSIDDLENQMPFNILYQNAETNNKFDGAAQFKRTLNSMYIQDDWTLSDTVTVTSGLRYDWISMNTAPAFNQTVVDSFNLPNDTNFDGLSLLQPRVGVNWDATERLNITAGAGRFSGGDPSVWLSNSFSNTGFLPGSSFSDDSAVINGFDGFNLPTEMQDQVASSAAAGTGATALVDIDYTMSSIWRFTLGAKYVADLSAIGLGDEWDFGVDFLYNIQENPNTWQNLDLAVIGTAPDGRPIYNSQFGYRSNGVMLLTNSDTTPQTKVFSGYFAKEFEKDRFTAKIYGGYAYTDAEDINPGTSSTQTSNYENVARIDYNNPIVARSNYGLTHAFTGRIDLGYEFIKDLKTRISLTGQLNSGKPFSYTFDTSGSSSGDAVAGGTNLFGDSDRSEDRSLLYIPSGPGATDDPLVAYAGGFDLAGFNAFLAATGLDEYRGQIAPRNSFESDWWGKVDLRFEQELPGLRSGDRLRFIIDVDNFTNLLNDDWGIYREKTFGNSGHNAEIVSAIISGGQYQFQSFDDGPAEQDIIFNTSVWEINFGLRYDF